MSDPLRTLWERADADPPVFSGDEALKWGLEVADRLASLGLLQEIEPTTSVICDACGGGHVEEVLFVKDPPNSEMRGYISCQENGRIPVALDRLRRWAVDFSGIARALARSLTG